MTNAHRAVASTGLLVAAMRAAESDRDDALFTDPFAAALAGRDGAGLLTDYQAATGPGPAIIEVRTRFWDEALRAAAERGARQFVILAAGMDARAFRLPWPSGAVVFEVDQATVVAAKDAALAAMPPRCERRSVGTDLTDDWSAPLQARGHDAATPTVWLIEGLLQYLEPAAVERLFAVVEGRSAPGSTVLYDVVGRTLLDHPAMASVRDFMSTLGAPWIYGTDDPAAVLTQWGWSARVTDAAEPAYEWGRWPQPPAPLHVPGVPRGYFVQAHKA